MYQSLAQKDFFHFLEITKKKDAFTNSRKFEWFFRIFTSPHIHIANYSFSSWYQVVCLRLYQRAVISVQIRLALDGWNQSMEYRIILIINLKWLRIYLSRLPWLKTILDFDDLMGPGTKDLNHLSQNIFTMIEENFGFWWSKMRPRMKDLNHFAQNIFTIAEKNFGFWWYEMPKNKGYEPLISEYLHHGSGKFWILMIWNAQEWRIWTTYLRISSPWLKKIFEFWWYEMPKNNGFEPLMTTFRRISSPWL